MKVYLAYASDDPEYDTLVGVYSQYTLSAKAAKNKADQMDEDQRRIFADDEDWEFVPAIWWVSEHEVREE